MRSPQIWHKFIRFGGASICFAAITCVTACGDRTVAFGTYDEMHGGGYTHPVSKKFGKAETEQLFHSLNSPAFHRELARFNCGDPIPNYRFAVALHPQGRYSERLVDYTSDPDIGTAGRDRCLSAGMFYLWSDSVGKLDRGEPINYHYHHPSGREFTPEEYKMPRIGEPICDCAKRDGKDEWVTYPATRE
jgi:hypothetical protein